MWLTHHTTPSPQPDVVEVNGAVDDTAARRLRDQLTEILHRHGPYLVLDLSGAAINGPAGVTALRAVARRAALLGGELLLAGPTGPTRTRLHEAGLLRLLRTYPTAGDAVTGGGPPVPARQRHTGAGPARWATGR